MADGGGLVKTINALNTDRKAIRFGVFFGVGNRCAAQESHQ